MVFLTEYALPEPFDFRLLDHKSLQGLFLFQVDGEWGSIFQHFFPNFKNVFEDLNVLERFDPKVFLDAMQNELVRESGESDHFDGFYADGFFEVAALDEMERE